MQGMKKRLGSPTSSLQNIPEENKMAGVSSRSKNKINVNQSVKSRDDIVFKRQSSFDRETFDSEDSTVTLTSLERADTNVQENDNVISDRDIDVEVEVKSPTPFGVFRRENKL
jgi:hypothetical protein